MRDPVLTAGAAEMKNPSPAVAVAKIRDPVFTAGTADMRVSVFAAHS